MANVKRLEQDKSGLRKKVADGKKKDLEGEESQAFRRLHKRLKRVQRKIQEKLARAAASTKKSAPTSGS